MPIKERDYSYTVVRGDSLNKIAEKHGMPGKDGAYLIWSNDKNSAMHDTGKMPNGTVVPRKIHEGGNKYRNFNKNNYKNKIDRDYNRPDQIILYSGEKLYIPNEKKKKDSDKKEKDDRIPVKIDTDTGKKTKPKGTIAGDGKKRKAIFPTFRIKIPEADIMPIPYPNTGKSSDSSKGSQKVLLNKNEAIVKLIGKNKKGEEKFFGQIKLKDLAVDKTEKMIFADFIGTPTDDDVKYTLYIYPGKDEKGNVRGEYIAFENLLFYDEH